MFIVYTPIYNVTQFTMSSYKTCRTWCVVSYCSAKIGCVVLTASQVVLLTNVYHERSIHIGPALFHYYLDYIKIQYKNGSLALRETTANLLPLEKKA